jgi:hypothetical protein
LYLNPEQDGNTVETYYNPAIFEWSNEEFLRLITSHLDNLPEHEKVIVVTHYCYSTGFCYNGTWGNEDLYDKNFVQEHDYIFIIPLKQVIMIDHNGYMTIIR